MTRSVVPGILEKLEPWLEERIRAWVDQPPVARAPTLPATVDGKVNVRALVEALGLPGHQAQHFFRHPPLRAAVNAVATEQGLLPIGARADRDGSDQTMDDAALARLRRAEGRASDLAKMVAEQAATIARLRDELASLKEQRVLLEQTGQILRTGPVR